jgi:hypothetical protein
MMIKLPQKKKRKQEGNESGVRIRKYRELKPEEVFIKSERCEALPLYSFGRQGR